MICKGNLRANVIVSNWTLAKNVHSHGFKSQCCKKKKILFADKSTYLHCLYTFMVGLNHSAIKRNIFEDKSTYLLCSNVFMVGTV